MNKWEAFTKIIESFNDHERPHHALVAVVTLALSTATVVLAITFWATAKTLPMLTSMF